MEDNKGLLPFRTVAWIIYQGTLNQSVTFCKVNTKASFRLKKLFFSFFLFLFFFFLGGGGWIFNICYVQFVYLFHRFIVSPISAIVLNTLTLK